jgi:hypothetical protein
VNSSTERVVLILKCRVAFSGANGEPLGMCSWVVLIQDEDDASSEEEEMDESVESDDYDAQIDSSEKNSGDKENVSEDSSQDDSEDEMRE